MDITKIKENKLGTILMFSIPSIIAMLLETVLTITDGFFTGNYVGQNALAAINLGLPILYLYLGIGLCVGVGGTVICGNLIGANNKKKADEVFSQTLIVSTVLCIITSIVVMFAFTPILQILKVEGELEQYFIQYYRIMLINYPLLVLGTVLGMFIRVDGKPQFCMFISIAGCIMNVILDYIFVARLDMGVAGSAIATIIIQLLTVVSQLLYFVSSNAGIHISRFAFDRNINKETLLNGSSEFIGEMASCISMFAFNYVLMKYVGVSGVAAFTIAGYAVYGYSMITIGFGQGMTPIVSLCWGAKEYETAKELRIITNKILFVVGCLFALSFVIFGKTYAGMFGCSDEVVAMVTSGFKFFSVTFLVMGYDVINSMYFTSCQDAASSALISMLRGIVLLLIFTFVFPRLWGMTGVWLVTPVTEALTAIVSVVLITKHKNKVNALSESPC